MDVGRKKLLWSFIHFNVCIGFVFFLSVHATYLSLGITVLVLGTTCSLFNHRTHMCLHILNTFINEKVRRTSYD